jgi:hypothetical protein
MNLNPINYYNLIIAPEKNPESASPWSWHSTICGAHCMSKDYHMKETWVSNLITIGRDDRSSSYA